MLEAVWAGARCLICQCICICRISTSLHQQSSVDCYTVKDFCLSAKRGIKNKPSATLEFGAWQGSISKLPLAFPTPNNDHFTPSRTTARLPVNRYQEKARLTGNVSGEKWTWNCVSPVQGWSKETKGGMMKLAQHVKVYGCHLNRWKNQSKDYLPM